MRLKTSFLCGAASAAPLKLNKTLNKGLAHYSGMKNADAQGGGMHAEPVNWAKVVWETLVTLSLIAIIILLIIEFFFHPDEKLLEKMHIVDIFALSFLFVELAYDFYRAENKVKFVKKEWLLILSFLPFGMMLRVAQLFRSTRVIKLLSTVWARVATLFRFEQTSVKTAQSAVHATKVGRVIRPAAQVFGRGGKAKEQAKAKEKGEKKK